MANRRMSAEPMEFQMIAVTGITGQVGKQLADELLARSASVRAVVRDQVKGEDLRARGCDIAIASMDDAAALTAAFSGASAVFVLLPPVFDPSPDFSESRRHIDALVEALRAARPRHVVALSTIGAQATQQNLLTQLQMLELALRDLPSPLSLLRAGWFIENVAWDVAPARSTGVLPSHLQPCDRPIPMVATADVARTVAELLLGAPPSGTRIVELEGPARISPDMLAAALGRAIGRSVKASAIPRTQWEAQFRGQGMNNPLPRMRMLDGFNEGWIDFERVGTEHRRGSVELAAVMEKLVAKASAAS
jgi:uncharacterized protein YbjT (DUF2867 family)